MIKVNQLVSRPRFSPLLKRAFPVALGVAVIVTTLISALACGGGDETPTSTPAPSASPTQSSIPTPSSNLKSFRGNTFSFDYPDNWNIWSQIFQSGQETAVIANVPPETPRRAILPPGVIKIELGSTDDLSSPVQQPPQNAQLVSMPPSTVKYFLWPGNEARWTVQGSLRTENRIYVVSVLMETQAPDIEAVAPILKSWKPATP